MSNEELPSEPAFGEDRLFHVQINRQQDGAYTVTDRNGHLHPISKRFGLSSHNCKCARRKTGLVLYALDPRHKNVVLLVCEDCYGYQPTGDTQHNQLLQWYNRIYGDSKQYRCVSGFSQRADGSLGFNSISQNTRGFYTNDEREMGPIERAIVWRVVVEQLHSYDADDD